LAGSAPGYGASVRRGELPSRAGRLYGGVTLMEVSRW